MHLNVCTIVGRVSKAGPKLSYAASGTPSCTLVVEVDEHGKGGEVFTTYLPVEITGKYAEMSAAQTASQHCGSSSFLVRATGPCVPGQ
jgi:hypothetical protein